MERAKKIQHQNRALAGYVDREFLSILTHFDTPWLRCIFAAEINQTK
jgi:hypothetical protein